MISELKKRSKVSRLLGMVLAVLMVGCFAVPDTVDAAVPRIDLGAWIPVFDKSEFVYDGTEQSVKIANTEEIHTAIDEAFAKDGRSSHDRSRVEFKVIVNGADPKVDANEIDITTTKEIKIGTEVGDSVTIDYIRVYYSEIESGSLSRERYYDGSSGKTFTIKPKPSDPIPQEKTYNVTFMSNKGKIKKNGKYTANKLTLVKTYGEKYGTLPKAKRTGYKFMGWYTKKTGGKKVTKNTVMKSSKNIKLYAHWTKNGKIVKCKSEWLRTGASKSSKAKAYVKKNQKVCIIKPVKNKSGKLWYKVKVGSKTGYLYSKYVKRV